MKSVLIAIFAALLLSGCMSPQQRAQWAAAIEARDNNQCVNFGAQPGTDAYTQCRMQLYQTRVQAVQAYQQQQAKAQQDFYDQQMANIRAARPNAPTNCMSNVIGNTVYTNCN